MEKVLCQDLIDLLYTSSDVSELCGELDVIGKELYKVGSNFSASLSAHLSSRFLVAVEKTFKDSQIDTSLPQNVQTFLTSICSELKGLPIAHIRFAFDPTSNFVADVSQWLRENIDKGIVLEITVDKHIIGGFLLDYDGRYWDLSVRTSFEKLFGGGNLVYLVRRGT